MTFSYESSLKNESNSEEDGCENAKAPSHHDSLLRIEAKQKQKQIAKQRTICRKSSRVFKLSSLRREEVKNEEKVVDKDQDKHRDKPSK